MEATIKREDLQMALKAVVRITGKPNILFLQTSNKGTLSIISNSTRYLRYRINAKKVKPGYVSLHTSILNELPSLRKDVISLKKKGNSLMIEGGTKLKVYCAESSKDEMTPPEIDSPKVVSIESKDVGIFRKLIEKVSFNAIGDDNNVVVKLINTNKSFIIAMADAVHCSFYYHNKPISEKPFSFITYLSMLQSIIPFLEDKSKLKISNNLLMVSSFNLLTTLPALQVGSDIIKNAKTALSKDNYKKGSVIFDLKKFEKVFSSISVVREGADILKMEIGSKKLGFELRTSFGISKDSIKCEKNSGKNMSLKLPVIMFRDVLNSCSFGEQIQLKIGKQEKFFMVSSSDKYYKVKSIAPLSSVQ